MSETKKHEADNAADIEVGIGYNRPVSFADLAPTGFNRNEAQKSTALKLLAEQEGVEVDLESTEAKRVLRKIDMRIMPLVLGLYTLQLLDKNSLSFAALMGIKEDSKLNGNQYDWLGSIIYFGYLFGEIPAAFMMQRVPLAKYLGVMSMLWGVVVALHAVCHNFGGLAAVRFLLGSIEVCTTPAIIYITSSWYTHAEQVTRVAIWYSTSGWAQVIGGFVAWAFNHADGFNWQGLFIFYGALTFTTGVIVTFFLAASPIDASWLSDDEKKIALERVRHNKTGTEMWAFNMDQLKESFSDPRLYLIFLVTVATGLPNGGLTAFEAAYTARYGGYILTMQYPNAILVVLAFITSGIGGSTKKLAFGASFQLGYAVGNICGPQTFKDSEAPHYFTAKYTMLAFLVCTGMLLASIGTIHWYWNRKRDRQDALDAQNNAVHEHIANEEFADLTDFKLRSFRYPL
ncbi:uncharacterized protein N7469_002373 [Penicillium citrinum]|uniref:Major facilitator superfamily (MFS) profile domain-containing protein n=1 Tax=Penicillium citrinum TaxID=5077 RepID=A0A9W9PAF9_PENCI|nr:uncharacterized protein N7469_002373 [Penicillium citrinum]KAJ5240782.1 hypothetical protein N7469_002373 [Penicillium citrinum]